MSFPRPLPALSTPLHDLLERVPALASATLVGDPATAVSGVSLNSREIRPGDLYAALPGANAHGATFAGAAVADGAVAVLTDPAGLELLRAAGIEVPVVVREDPRAVLGDVAGLLYGTRDSRLKLVGITGTNGKTTTAYLVVSALAALGEQTGLIGTVETRVGPERIKSVRTTPEATDLHALLAVMEERGLHTCVMEVSSHALTLHRVDGVVYDVALFTNLSQDHLDFHPTMQDYFEAKASLFTRVRSREGIVCVDDEWGRELAVTATVPVITLSSVVGVDADWRLTPDGLDLMAFALTDGDTTMHLRSALPGEFNRVNTAMAALTLLRLGRSTREIERAILADPHVPGRMERVAPTDGPRDALPLAVVDYAHTPEAVEAALSALRPTTSGSLVVVLGAGGDRDKGKRAAMGRAAAQCADIVIVTDDNPRSEDPAAIRAAVLAGTGDTGGAAAVEEVAGRGAAIRAAVLRAVASGPGATVAVVGKGHETGQEIAGVVHPFDDRTELRVALDEAVATLTRASAAPEPPS